MLKLPHGFDIYLVSVKTMRKNGQIFVALSKKLKFMHSTNVNYAIAFGLPNCVGILNEICSTKPRQYHCVMDSELKFLFSSLCNMTRFVFNTISDTTSIEFFTV